MPGNYVDGNAKPLNPKPDISPNVRSALAEVFQKEFSSEYLTELVGQIKSSTKGLRAEVVCRHCQKRQITTVQVPDWDKILIRAMDLLEQTEGRPGVLAVEDAGVTLVVERSWPR
jgi:hypothetical protein